MSESEVFTFSPADFNGRARLFPLPNLVMFPQVMQPLHIFEPRYRAMLEEAIGGDGLIAMAVLAPGWEKNYEGRPPLLPMACLCRVTTWNKQPDGCYNILVLGLRRIRLVRELPSTKLFREADVELFEDEYPLDHACSRPKLQRRLLEAFKKVVPKMAEVQDQWDYLISAGISLGTLTDVVSYTLALDVAVKESLLAEPNVDRRAELLIELLAGDQPLGVQQCRFPPDFSEN